MAIITSASALGNGPNSSQPTASSGTSYCGAKFKMFGWNLSPEAIAAKNLEIEKDLQKLKSIKMKDLFKVKAKNPFGSGASAVTNVQKQEIAPFKIEFDHLLDQQARLDPDFAAELPNFRNWLWHQPNTRGAYPTLVNGEIDQFVKKDATLNDYSEFLYSKYLVDKSTKEGFYTWVKGLRARSVKHVFKLLVNGSLLRSKVFLGAFWGTTIAAPVNALWYGLQEPIKRYIGIDDKNIKDNAAALWEEALKKIYESFDGGKEKYEQALIVIDEKVKNIRTLKLDQMDRVEARKVLNSNEYGLKAVFSKFSKSLDLADKDRHTRQRDILKTLLASAQFSDVNYSKQKDQLDKLEDSIKNRGYPANDLELEDIETMKKSMKISERYLAQFIATWKVYKFTLGPGQEELVADLDAGFNLFQLNYMNNNDLDVYKEELLTQVNAATNKLKEIMTGK